MSAGPCQPRGSSTARRAGPRPRRRARTARSIPAASPARRRRAPRARTRRRCPTAKTTTAATCPPTPGCPTAPRAPSSTTEPSAACMSPNAASRVNEMRLAATRTTASNTSISDLRRWPRRDRPASAAKPATAAPTPATDDQRSRRAASAATPVKIPSASEPAPREQRRTRRCRRARAARRAGPSSRQRLTMPMRVADGEQDSAPTATAAASSSHGLVERRQPQRRHEPGRPERPRRRAGRTGRRPAPAGDRERPQAADALQPRRAACARSASPSAASSRPCAGVAEHHPEHEHERRRRRTASGRCPRSGAAP